MITAYSPLHSPLSSPLLSPTSSSFYLSPSASLSSLSLSSFGSSSARSSVSSTQSSTSFNLSSTSYEPDSTHPTLIMPFSVLMSGMYTNNYEGLSTASLDRSSDAEKENIRTREKFFESKQIALDNQEIGKLGETLKTFIAESDRLYHPEFVIALIEPQLERLIELPGDLLDVLEMMVNDDWISHDKTRDRLEKIISKYKEEIPNSLSKMSQKGIKEISKPISETPAEILYKKGKKYLGKLTDFFDVFYNDSNYFSHNSLRLTELIAKSLIGSAVNFIAIQYIFPAIQRRWQ